MMKHVVVSTVVPWLLFAASARADIVYGDFSDIPPGVVKYSGVRESSATDPVPPARYGVPTITGNVLDFAPTSFGAAAEGSDPSVAILDGQLNFDFSTIAQYGLTGLSIYESGDFTLVGAGTDNTAISGGVFAEISITHVDFVPLDTWITVTASAYFTDSLNTSPGSNNPWNVGITIDFSPSLTNAGFDPNVSAVTSGNVVIDNTLSAFSEPATIAFVSKKDFSVVSNTMSIAAVPEPSAFLCSGLIGVLAACGYRLKRRLFIPYGAVNVPQEAT